MSIIVTPGEKTIIQEFENADIPITIKNLHVGDIHIEKDGVPVYIFERKAKGDLDASIKDGRYHEQKERLIKTGLPRRQIVYLIEQMTKPRPGPSHTRLWSSICHSMHRDGFTVFATKNPKETVDYILAMKRAIDKFPVYSKDAEEPEREQRITLDIKKRQVTPAEWVEYSLMLIPGVSTNIAKSIVNEYPTLQIFAVRLKRMDQIL